MDTLDDVAIDDDVDTELDVETLDKIAEDYQFIFVSFFSVIRNVHKINGFFTSYSWVLDGNTRTGIRANKTYCYLEEVDTLDDVDIDDDVDTELEVDTLKNKKNCSFKTM